MWIPPKLSATSAQHGSMIGDDDQYDAFYMPTPAGPTIETFLDTAAERLYSLEKMIKAIEGNNIFGSETVNMRLVSNLLISAKFKTLDFEKYKGKTCPKKHLVMYFWKLAAHTKNDKLLIHYFQDSLSGASLMWYMSLE